MEREACVCDHGFERSDLCAEIIIIIIITDVTSQYPYLIESPVFIAPLAFMEIARSRIVMLGDTRKDDARPAATSAA